MIVTPKPVTYLFVNDSAMVAADRLWDALMACNAVADHAWCASDTGAYGTVERALIALLDRITGDEDVASEWCNETVAQGDRPSRVIGRLPRAVRTIVLDDEVRAAEAPGALSPVGQWWLGAKADIEALDSVVGVIEPAPDVHGR